MILHSLPQVFLFDSSGAFPCGAHLFIGASSQFGEISDWVRHRLVDRLVRTHFGVGDARLDRVVIWRRLVDR